MNDEAPRSSRDGAKLSRCRKKNDKREKYRANVGRERGRKRKLVPCPDHSPLTRQPHLCTTASSGITREREKQRARVGAANAEREVHTRTDSDRPTFARERENEREKESRTRGPTRRAGPTSNQGSQGTTLT